MAKGEWTLQPVYRLPREPAGETLIHSGLFGFETQRQKSTNVAFQAIATVDWLPGLIPIFAIDKGNNLELRRRPPQGQENITEPFFFALPPMRDTNAPVIAGYWQCEAVRGNGTTAWLGFELANDQQTISARFDQSSEYRFGFITGGTFITNRLELKVEYVNDEYLLTGLLRDGKFQGHWSHVNGDERGQWQAWRNKLPFSPPPGAVDLYEWRGPELQRRYGFHDEPWGSLWTRSPSPLCCVWRPE